MKKILHLCADTGSDSRPYKDAGYDVILVGSKIGVENYVTSQDVYGVIANPVCTEFSLARGKQFKGNIEKGMFLVNECLRIINACNPVFWVIENPATGILKTILGPPTYVYEPWEFGDPWSKKTALWGRFNTPIKKYKHWIECPKNESLYIQPGRGKPSIAKLHKSAFDLIPAFKGLPRPNTDSEFRSLCPQGFANAFFDVNK